MKTTVLVSIAINILLISLIAVITFTNRELIIQRVSYHIEPAKILMIGDSHSEAGKWNCMLGRFDIQTIARGGSTSEQVHRLIADAKDVNAKYGFVLCGTNDLMTRHFTTDEYVSNVDSIVVNLKGRSIKPVVQTVFYVLGNERLNDSIKVMNRKLATYCKTNSVDLIDVADVLSINGDVDRKIYRDNVHLNSDGYVKWSRILSKYLESNRI